MKELELAERCRRGDNQARQVLYERYAGRMLGICLRYVGDRALAEDLLHDGFLQLFCSFNKFRWRGDGSLRAWMERVMVNTVLQYLRRNDVLQQALGSDSLPELCDEPSTDEIDRLPYDVLMQLIARLPTGYRTVLNLYIFEEKPHKEIAGLLGINEKSSASQLARAKALLASWVHEWLRKNE
ncbi:MAG: sigma-70 family RNA polymerase sigma factor [Bacteroides sp.]|nr:sigma-70 family RNA polymerase sigma factor [Bacteroides sp.]